MCCNFTFSLVPNREKKTDEMKASVRFTDEARDAATVARKSEEVDSSTVESMSLDDSEDEEILLRRNDERTGLPEGPVEVLQRTEWSADRPA